MGGRSSGKTHLRAGHSRPPTAGGPAPKTLPRSTDQMCESAHARDFDLMSTSEVGRTVVHRLFTLFVLRRRFPHRAGLGSRPWLPGSARLICLLRHWGCVRLAWLEG